MLAPAKMEFDRFLVLFDQLASETSRWIKATPPEKFEWLPVDNSNLRFGDRISRVTIKSLYIHIAVVEHVFIRMLKACEPRALLPLPKDPELTARLASGDVVIEAAKLHQEDMSRLRSYDDDVLRKTVRFAGDDTIWSVMGFLWSLYAHRAYHLGNIDIYIRQADVPAPDFYSFQPKEMA
jgi:uncharacterized damage-inducible protein DinB